MGKVKVDSEELVALDGLLDATATALTEKLAALDLPEADLQPLLDDVERLRGLVAMIKPRPRGAALPFTLPVKL